MQNLVDLGLEIPGVMFGLVVTLGSLWGDRRRTDGDDSTLAAERPRLALGLAGGLLVLGTGVLLNAGLRGMRDVALDRVRLAEKFNEASPPRSRELRAELRGQIRAAITRHPAEPYFPLVGGTLAWQEHDQNPLPWLQRVLERSLVNGKAHLLLAQVLMAVPSRSQALLELRLAVESDGTLTGLAAGFALKWAQSFDEVLSTIPAHDGRAESLDALGGLATDREIGARCDRLAVELAPGLVGPHERLAADLVKELGSPDGCQDPDRCQADLEGHILAIEKAEPGKSSATRLRAARLAALGLADEAEKALAEECESFDDYEVCLRERVLLASQIPEPERLLAAEKALLGAVCSEQEACADAATWAGGLHAGRGEWGAAVSSFKAAVRDGETPDRLVLLATAASKTGMHAQAARALERALQLKGGRDEALKQQVLDERAAAMDPIVGR